MRNKYSTKFEEKMKELAPTKTLDKLLQYACSHFGYEITKDQLRQYLSKRNIRYKGYKSQMKRNMGAKVPIGTECVKPDGMTLVKTAPNKWQYKQRLIYEQHYGVKLNSDDYIIFLDQDRTNFDIKNLKRVSRYESAILSNQNLYSHNPKVTETGIEVAKLMIKIKEKNNEREKD